MKNNLKKENNLRRLLINPFPMMTECQCKKKSPDLDGIIVSIFLLLFYKRYHTILNGILVSNFKR